MLADAIRNPRFSYFFSFMLGVGVMVIIFHKECKEGDSKCTKNKAPSIEEVKDSIYVIGSSCYKFKDTQIKCPDDGNIVESFKQEFSSRG
jgi:hypothetical protein